MSLYELMLYLHRAFLASATAKGECREKMGRVVQEKNGFTQGSEESTKKGECGDRCIKPKEVSPSYCMWWVPQLIANRCAGCWELTWFQNAVKQINGKEIHEGH